jgi:hypothetical protein
MMDHGVSATTFAFLHGTATADAPRGSNCFLFAAVEGGAWAIGLVASGLTRPVEYHVKGAHTVIT